MRKLLMLVLIVLLLAVTVYSVTKGLSIGNIRILGYPDVKIESAKIDEEIKSITTMKEVNYKKTLSDIESNAKVLLQEKEKYASLVSASTDSEIEKATHAQNYEQDFLWAKIGNHATAQGVKLKFDIAIGSINKENFDLHFTVTGSYTNITEFILALENDNLLGFKIENFKLVPVVKETAQTNDNKTNSNTVGNNNNSEDNNTVKEQETKGELQATFDVLDIGININKSLITTNAPQKPVDANVEGVATDVSTTNTDANAVAPTADGVVNEEKKAQ